MVRTRGGKKRSRSGLSTLNPVASAECADESSSGPIPSPDNSIISDTNFSQPSTSGTSKYGIQPDPFGLSKQLLKSVYTSEELKCILDSDEEFLSEGNSEIDCSALESNSDDDVNEPVTVTKQVKATKQQLTDRQWTKEKPNRDEIPFTESTGVTFQLDKTDPIDFFRATLSDEMIDVTIRETNRFANKLKEQNTSSKARIRQWKPLNVEEFLTWLGLLYHMGTISVSRISDYWNTGPLFSIPIFRSCMSRDRFCSILQSLHFTESPNSPTDRLTNVRPILNAFNTTMDIIYKPTKQLCIDESVLLWRGRLIFRVYLKGKRHKYGIKLYILTDTSGLVLRVLVYAGASDPDVGGKGHAEKVVHKLMEGKLDRGHSLFMDNYYNSVPLAHQLLERKTYVTGTLRTNRKGNPCEVRMADLEDGDVAALFSDESVCVMKFKDRKDVLMISSEFGADMVETQNRRGTLQLKPEAAVKYNKLMGGIDHADQMMAYYPIERKTIKWYKKVAIHIFHIVLINSFCLYKKSFPDAKTNLYDFRLSVISSLILPSRTNRLVKNPTLKKQTIEHIPKQYKPKDGQQRPERKRCRLCYGKKIRKDTMYFCPFCSDNPPLCKNPCFEEYHKGKTK